MPEVDASFSNVILEWGTVISQLTQYYGGIAYGKESLEHREFENIAEFWITAKSPSDGTKKLTDEADVDIAPVDVLTELHQSVQKAILNLPSY